MASLGFIGLGVMGGRIAARLIDSGHAVQKDMLVAPESGRRFGVPLPTSSATNECLTAARAAGFGEQDCAAVFHLLAQWSGVPV